MRRYELMLILRPDVADDKAQAVIDRTTRQLQAIRRHRSQSSDNPVLWRRLDLLGPTEHLRRLA